MFPPFKDRLPCQCGHEAHDKKCSCVCREYTPANTAQLNCERSHLSYYGADKASLVMR